MHVFFYHPKDSKGQFIDGDKGDHFRFGSVFIKKITKLKYFFFEKKNRNRVKPTGFGSVRFGFFRAKTGSNRFGSVFSVFSGFGSVFPVWLGFLSVSVRFGFSVFRFFVYKTETEPNRPVFSKI